jgi:hypothetical protein
MRLVHLARIGLLLFTLAAVITVAVNAQQPTPQPTPSVQPTNAQSTPAGQPSSVQPVPPLQPKVIKLEGNLEADDLIKVEVEHLSDWTKTNDPAKLVPYLDGIALYGNYPDGINTTTNHLRFHLRITPQNKESWTDLLGGPTGTRRQVSFSVGLERQSKFDSVFDEDHPATLTVIYPVDGIIAVIAVVVTFVMLIWLARKTNLIRDPGPQPAGGKLRPYNLGRTQMAFWFFMIYASYVVIWLITGALDTITPSLLALMGISAGTALGAAMIDSGKEASRITSLQDLTAEKQALEQSIPQLQLQLDALQAKSALTPEDISNRDSLNKQLQEYRTRLNQVSQQIQALTPQATDAATKGFLRDVLGDSSGYSFHRFQIFAWTFVLGILFVDSVYWSLSMPEFSNTLLGLMGISSGTYLGFKFPEQK